MNAYKCRVCLCAYEAEKTIKISDDFGWSSNFEYSATTAIDGSCKRAWQYMIGTADATEFEVSIYLEEFFGPMSPGLGCAFIRHKGPDIKTVYEEAKAKILAQIGEKR